MEGDFKVSIEAFKSDRISKNNITKINTIKLCCLVVFYFIRKLKKGR